MKNIDLSICVQTYNYEKYIKKALDSIFKQETSYIFEVLVGEDCSMDKTREVLKQYEIEHKDYINNGQLKVFYRPHNMNNESPNNSEDLKKYCRGKYAISLEGDDEALSFRCIMQGIKRKQCTFKEGIKYIKDIKHKLFSLWKWYIYKIRKDILHKRNMDL